MEGKRPYYVITYIRDYDGYESHIEYIGTNYKAALNRYKNFFEYIKERDFLNDGIEEDGIECRLDIPHNQLQPGQCARSYLNDQNEFYVTIEFLCITTNHFMTPQMETRYKTDYPNAKY